MQMHHQIKGWMRIVSGRFPKLTLPQVRGLASWSFGIALSQSSSLSRVAYAIALLNDEPMNRVRQRLKEWYQEADAKRGRRRRTLEVSSCFEGLLRWVVALLPSGTRSLRLAMDASNIKQRFTVLSIAVLYEECAIPVAWKVVAAGAKGGWKEHWQQLFKQLHGVVPSDWHVIVCADRGLYADWLYHTIVALGWHPFLRINHHQGQFQGSNQSQWQPLSQVVATVGEHVQQQVRCFKENTLECTLLGCWELGYQEPWLIVTDLAPTEANVLWYGFRAWIECSYRDLKSDGWQWQNTRLQDPQRAERLWLAMAVAMLWVVTLGSHSDRHPSLPASASSTGTSRAPRSLSCFSQGWLALIVHLIKRIPITLPTWFPQPLPLLGFNST